MLAQPQLWSLVDAQEFEDGPVTATEHTIGVDLSTERKDTGLCILDWSEGTPVIRQLKADVTVEDIVAARAKTPGTVAIDCPFGWPEAFADFLQRHRARVPQPSVDRNVLRMRVTDRHVKEVSGKTPLSVATDKLGSTAIYCAQLLQSLGQSLSRAGTAGVIEVYPAVSMKQWGFDTNAHWKDFLTAIALSSKDQDLENPHCRDALVAAVTARAYDCTATHAIPEEHLAIAELEGWIHVPTKGSLESLSRRS